MTSFVMKTPDNSIFIPIECPIGMSDSSCADAASDMNGMIRKSTENETANLNCLLHPILHLPVLRYQWYVLSEECYERVNHEKKKKNGENDATKKTRILSKVN